MKNTTETKEKNSHSSYTKGQRILAMVGVVILVVLYLVTLVAAITTSAAAPELFRMCIGSTILLPIVFWFYIRIGRYFMNRDRENMKKYKDE